ncbi:hypothetical protein E2C01_100703 [Portunus trituberculatus]|uniref:Uncharacterized protein n=1 Tax=Portunus trituberculatus TaxID=210409 RepID=A0A5B7KDP7_PORTR|nr:hypothetical protein [Portunus trituberculatus]
MSVAGAVFGTLGAIHQTLAVRGGSFRGERAPYMSVSGGVVCGTLYVMHQTLTERGGSSTGERTHFMTVVWAWCVVGHCSWRSV